MKQSIKKSIYAKQMRFATLCAALLTLCCNRTIAQSFSKMPGLLQPSGTQFYLNQYMANPAMAGIDSGLTVNAAHRRQWTNIDGAPVTTFITADMDLGGRSGVGLNIYTDKAGQLNTTRVALSYAYHLPLSTNGEQQLHFGLSLAVNSQRVRTDGIEGDPGDPSIINFNDRKNYFEVEYGMAYMYKQLTVQAALPNARALFSSEEDGINGGSVLFAAASWKFNTNGSISSIEPKIGYRNIKAYDDIIDAGVQIGFLDGVANVMGIYHSSKSFTVGAGVNIVKTVSVQALYTSQTGGVKTYADGTYELGVKVGLFK